jgi:hypothetical protein
MKTACWKNLELGDLGDRICIIGPSNSGKSTLAMTLSDRLNLRCCHLDQIAHVPDSNWQRRSDSDFIREHDDIINQEKWVIDGNYSVCMPQRFDRATSVIWLDPSLLGSISRYILRSIRNDENRPGRLKGATQEFSFNLIKYTLFNYPKNKRKYVDILSAYSDLPIIKIQSLTELNRAYKHWHLEL